MATYYRWRKSTISKALGLEKTCYDNQVITDSINHNNYVYISNSYEISGDEITLTGDVDSEIVGTVNEKEIFSTIWYTWNSSTRDRVFRSKSGSAFIFHGTNGTYGDLFVYSGVVDVYKVVDAPGTSRGYVYSTSSSAYPNGGVQGGYYYDQRTTVTSPTAPTGLTYPATITEPSVDVSWAAATSNTNYPVSGYQVDVSVNGGTNWTTAGTPSTNSLSYSIPAGVTSIMFRVRAKDSNNQWGSYVTGTQSQVILAPDLTAPPMVMQGQPATISWTAIDGADSYTLQRKSSADTDWTHVYSGTDTTFTETVGSWTSLQYRVQAVFDGTPGGWATSDPIQIVSASALVISGQDGDLGTLVNDVQYSISSDQTSPTITATVEVNGGEYASFQATSGQTYTIGVLDLPTGTGSIVITASTEVSSSPVTVTRTWTYSKTAQTFPNTGGVAELTKEEAVIWPKTLDEAVRAAMNPWGGNLSTALNLLKNAALFNRTNQPKYSEVTVSLSGKAEGQTIQLPENGRMVEFYVAKLDYESALNGVGRALLVRKDCYDQRAWDAGDVNAWASSDLLTWLNGTYKELFPEEVQTAMGATTYYYTPGNGNNAVTTRSDAVFQASATELGESENWFNVEGSPLPIADQLKIAYLNGSAKPQWTRSPRTTNYTNLSAMLSSTGNVDDNLCSYYDGSRPIFTLPSTFTYGPVYVDQGGTIHASQEYTEAGDWLDVWGNAIPAVKLETGSYIGTGTYKEDNPNELTFSIKPKVLMIPFYYDADTSGNWTQFTTLAGNIWTWDFLQKCYDEDLYFGVVSDGGEISPAPCIVKSISENSISWARPDSAASGTADSQLNRNGAVYYYIALG